MRTIILISLLIAIGAITKIKTMMNDKNDYQTEVTSLYEIKINTLLGDKIDLKNFKGKYLLFVNVASKCGFTPQYKELQELHEEYKDKLTIIGLPCNQFGNQEPGTANDIKTFCEKNYGVEFLITEKIDVKGPNQHALYAWLTNKELNGVQSSTVKWNFQKYLVDTNGNLMNYYLSTTSPKSKKITAQIK